LFHVEHRVYCFGYRRNLSHFALAYLRRSPIRSQQCQYPWLLDPTFTTLVLSKINLDRIWQSFYRGVYQLDSNNHKSHSDCHFTLSLKLFTNSGQAIDNFTPLFHSWCHKGLFANAHPASTPGCPIRPWAYSSAQFRPATCQSSGPIYHRPAAALMQGEESC
jgi:hypothetical protein